ncbi:MAG: tetratricopeptide repeat protein [Planctomycetaceae bacterium]|jgi:tetratricopeptide (TPR) repeat protein|nr:tetratricopeptide repeat protein [Planctomycetaceae bacterium]
MSVYEDFGNHGGRQRETLDDAVRRLRGELASGELHVRAELAELLMRQSHFAAESTRFDDAVRLVNESIAIVDELIKDGQVEFRLSAVRCKMFKAVLIRLQKGIEAALQEHNDVIRYINENIPADDLNGVNMLAITLMNKSDILNSLGANAAAAAAQEQAARIWEKLINAGSFEFRSQLITALLALGSTHVQMGDLTAGLADYQRSLSFIRDGIDGRLIDDETDYTGYLIQTLMNISRLVDRFGNTRDAISYANEAVDTIVGIVTSGQPQIMPILTGLYQHRGMLLEKAGNHSASLDDFERARDIYRQSLRHGPLGSPADYVVRTGLANVLMCCANIYVNMDRFDDAESTYDEAVRIYQQAAEFRPVGDDDETFIPYSIGIIRLNYANMLADQGRFSKAIILQEQAVAALTNRYEEGHPEILPNLVSAYRKMVGVQRSLLDFKAVFATLDKLVMLLEAALDEGNFEYRGELAMVFALRSVVHRELREFDAAIENTVRAMHIFRAIADDEIDVPETPWSKLQWGESLAEVAKLYLAKGNFTDGFDFFKKQIDMHYADEDNNKNRLFDLLFGYSQYAEFVTKFLQNESAENLTKDESRRIVDSAIEITNRGIELVRKVYPAISKVAPKIIIDGVEFDKIGQDKNDQDNVEQDNVEQDENDQDKVEQDNVEQDKNDQDKVEQDNVEQDKNDQDKVEQDKKDQDKIEQDKVERDKKDQDVSEKAVEPLVKLFFLMKYTFFHQLRGSLYQEIGEVDLAVCDYELSFNGWTLLILDLDKLYLQRQYYVRELEAMRAMEAERQFDGNYFESVKAMAEMERRVPSSDFFEERWRYYVSELRGMLQRWALLELSLGKVYRAGMVYHLDVNLARDMVRRKITNADRYLLVSLLSYAKAMEVSGKIFDSFKAFTEVVDLICNRLSLLDCCLEDYEMLRHVMFAFAAFLSRSNFADRARDVLNLYVTALEEFRLSLPDWQQWQELCVLPNIKPYADEFKQRCDNLLNKHPEVQEKEKEKEKEKQKEKQKGKEKQK